jgi:hypothetical protein
MRRIYLLAAFPFLSMISPLSDPITWSYEVKKAGKDLLEVHIVARLQEGYHIYSMQQPAKNYTIPTTIRFTGIHGVSWKLEGAIQEVADVKPVSDPSTGKILNELEHSAEYIQLVRGNLTLSEVGDLIGQVKYQICTKTECLRPSEQEFKIFLQPTKDLAPLGFVEK